MTSMDVVLFWIGIVLFMWSWVPFVAISPRSVSHISIQIIALSATAILASLAAHQLWG